MKTRAALATTTLLLATFAAACGGGGTESVPLDGGADAGPVVVLDGGGAPATPPDGPSLCPQGACNYQTNIGCPTGEGCVPVADQSGGVPPTCAPAGQGKSGAACAAVDECAPGYLCAGGQCHKMCCGGDWTGCPSESEHCVQKIAVQNNNGLTVATGGMICVTIDTCDALAPADCPTEGQTCQIVDPTGATFCLPEGTGDIGEACPCKGGSLCVDKQCRRLCKAVEGGGEPYCQEGEGICVHYNRDPEGVGECTPDD